MATRDSVPSLQNGFICDFRFARELTGPFGHKSLHKFHLWVLATTCGGLSDKGFPDLNIQDKAK